MLSVQFKDILAAQKRIAKYIENIPVLTDEALNKELKGANFL